MGMMGSEEEGQFDEGALMEIIDYLDEMIAEKSKKGPVEVSLEMKKEGPEMMDSIGVEEGLASPEMEMASGEDDDEELRRKLMMMQS